MLAAESDDVAQAHRELYQAVETLHTSFRQSLDDRTLPPTDAVRSARRHVVGFCRTATRLGAGGCEVRRLVGQAMRNAVAPWHCPPHGVVWERAAQRLVDEIYLLGEHRS